MNTTLARVARYEPGRSPIGVHSAAPLTGTYVVRYAIGSSKRLRTIEGTARVVGRGGALGFATSDAGRVLAYACTETLPLPDIPESTRYFVWIAKEQKPKQFAHEFEKG